MTTVVTVQFRPVGRTYDFNAHNFADLERDEYLIVEGKDGPALVQVVQPPHSVRPDREPTKSVLRRATVWDLLERERLKDLESEALDLWQSEARERGLRMRVLECSYNLDGGQLTVSYRASGKRRRQREMRNLQRDMARRLKARIEMREVRDREAAKLLDGVGKCGRQLCCTTWLREFRHIRPEMARTQQLTENRDEITGVCGRLLCCLSYEDEMYRSLTRSLPKVGARVVTPQGAGKVRYIFPLKKTVTVTLENDINAEFGVDELLPPKQDPSCGSCGGCTATRRAEGEREAEQRAQDQQATAA
ncbi:MAG: hypothetical protein F4X16_03540 [Caldilineaceae bacterium SB0661_bin_34]|nr:hypothetical protein [Caldilineaceae bacterium SB0661_bin_34]